MGVVVGAGIAVAGIAAGVGGIFASEQQKRAAAEASRVINQARQQGLAASDALMRQYAPFTEMSNVAFANAMGLAGESQRYLMDQGSQIEVGQGLSAADEIAYKDAAKLLNEQMVSTGNLRSGAAAFGQSELLRRVVADANQRNFDRRVAKLSVMFGGMNQGAQLFGQLGQATGQIGIQGQSIASNLLANSMGLAGAQGNAIMAKGDASASGIMSGAGIVGSVASGVMGGMNYASTANATSAMANYYNSQAKK